MTTHLTINGSPRSTDAPGDVPLLWVLRDEIGLTGTKYGCGVAACGACTVHIDGEAVRSCTLPVENVRGRRVVTIEGLSPADAPRSHPVQRAWLAENVPQCGFCQSGQIMAAAALLARTSQPDDAAIDHAMSGNLCRCGAYQRIRAAIHRAAGG